MADLITIDRAVIDGALACLTEDAIGDVFYEETIAALRAALAQPAPTPTVEFGHGIGADRFKVVRGSYWWHILIGDSQIKRGKFHTRAGAEEMVALLLREFRNGAFVQHITALRAASCASNGCAEAKRLIAKAQGGRNG